MRIASDAAGRLVVPKALRAELGIRGPAELEGEARDGVTADRRAAPVYRALGVAVEYVGEA